MNVWRERLTRINSPEIFSINLMIKGIISVSSWLEGRPDRTGSVRTSGQTNHNGNITTGVSRSTRAPDARKNLTRFVVKNWQMMVSEGFQGDKSFFCTFSSYVLASSFSSG